MKKIAVYGLSTETEKELARLKEYEIVGLLDGFKSEGKLYGKKIISLDEAISYGIDSIIVVARPGSCKSIVRRIGDECRKHNIKVCDTRENDLLNSEQEIFSQRYLKYLFADLPFELSSSDTIKKELFLRHFQRIQSSSDLETDSIIPGAYDVGYLFFAPIITDFVIWLSEYIIRDKIDNIWFCARDGYLVKQLFDIMNSKVNSVYFMTSRIAAIRAGVESEEDLRHVDSMKFSGTLGENIRERFGVILDDFDSPNTFEENGILKHKELILNRAKMLKSNYKKYIDKLNISDQEVAFFDFVAKGTTQYFLQKMMPNELRGFYFLQLESEILKSKSLCITPFYDREELSTNAIYDNYYILETVLTSSEPSCIEFDNDGKPVFAKESRTNEHIECIERAQKGIIDYFNRYIELSFGYKMTINKQLDEMILKLIHNVEIKDNDFLSLIVEDPFFNRMTDIKDVL